MAKQAIEQQEIATTTKQPDFNRMNNRCYIALLSFLLLHSFSGKSQDAPGPVMDSSLRIIGIRSYTNIRVVDKRTARIPGTDSILMNAFGDQLLAQNLADYSRYVLRNAGKEPNELLIVVHDLVLHDKPNKLPVCSAMLNADGFIGKDGKYELCFRNATYMEVPNNKKSVNALGRLTSLLLCKFLDTTSHYHIMTHRMPQPHSFSYEEAIVYRQQEIAKYPVYNTAVYKEGLYKTRQDFLNQLPDSNSYVIDGYYNSNQRQKELGLFRKKENGKAGQKMASKDFFAAFYGNKWYRSGAYGLKPMEVIGNDFYSNLVIRQPSLTSTHKVNSGAIVAGSILGGIIGGAIVAAVSEAISDPVNDPDVLLVPVTYRCIFDPISVRFVPQERLDYAY